MLKTSINDAMMLLTEALHRLPTEPDPRSEFFIQWRTRTIEAIERIFSDDPLPAQMFKEIEFSPRRLTRDTEKDEQLKLDACLAGCSEARALLERLMAAVNQPPETEMQTSETSVPPKTALASKDAAAVYSALCSSIASAVAQPAVNEDPSSNLAASAQLLRVLTTGLADQRLRDATEAMLDKVSVPAAGKKIRPDWEQADVFVWSMLIALGELKKSA